MPKSLPIACVVALCAAAASPAAEAYPTRPVRLVAFRRRRHRRRACAAGRERSRRAARPTFVVDNRAGANGIIGSDMVAKAQPDGHALLHVTASFVINPYIYTRLPYDIFKDFAPVTNVVLGTGYLLVVHPAVPVSSVQDLIALAKKTDKVSYSSPGVGNTLHLAAELFNVRTGVKLLHVPYKGVAPAMNASSPAKCRRLSSRRRSRWGW